MSARPWRIGLVGLGRGSVYSDLFARRCDCEIAGCCDSSEEALREFQGYLNLPNSRCFTRYKELLAVGLDAVFVGTPILYHAEQCVSALEAGISVLCEVTAASTVDDCRRIVEAARRSRGIYMLAENCIFWPFVQEWKRIAQSGRLGDIFYAECEYIHPISELIVEPETGRRLWRAQRPPLHYCTHSLGPVLDILGHRITRAMGLGKGMRILPDGLEGGIDIQVALFETDGGAIIKLLRSSVAPRRPSIHYYTLQGTKGFVETDRLGPSGKGLLYIQDEMESAQEIECAFADKSLPLEAQAGGHGTAEYEVVAAFLHSLQTGEKPPLDETVAVNLTVPGLIAHESAMKDGMWLDVPAIE